MLHENGDHYVDQHELSHQDKYDEKHGRNAVGYATVFHAVRRVVTVLAECVLHDTVPIVTSGYSEQRQECHAEISKVSVFTQALARVLVAALCL